MKFYSLIWIKKLTGEIFNINGKIFNINGKININNI